MNASGTDIEGISDQFHYVYQPLSGDGTIVARVASITNTNPWAKGGVMIRESLAGNSTQAMMVLTPGNGVAFQRRLTTGGFTATTMGASVVAPYWVKVVRSGSTFSGYSSSDGNTWTLVGSDTIAMATNVYFGLALTSHNNAALCTATLNNVSASAGSGPFTIRLEAESATLTSPMAVGNDVAAFGGKYAFTSTTDSGTATWTFTVPTSGSYYIWSRVLAPDGQHDSFYPKANGGSEDIYDDAQGTWSPSWQWTVLNGRNGTGVPLTLNPRVLTLSSGTNSLTFRGREIGSKLDRILITNDPAYVPTEAP